ncbi:MAG: LysR family transcriptional regulator [Gluconacetobacter diazotrophicus]|nr:LysR family transcriptional regulator [Gluconacetobacter diazotrophicus]
MELRHVRYFLAVAEELNFTRAAAKVGIGQPPLSQQIRSLEHELGAPLFRRLAHGAELTEAGLAFLPEARALVTQAERAAHSARLGARGQVGRLRVGFTGSAAFCPAVPAALRAFRRRYPAVELSLEEAPTATLLERLRGGHLDGVFIRPGRCDPAGVKVYALDEEPFVAVLPSGHALAKAGSLTLSALAGETFVLFARRAGPSLFDEITAACRQAGFEPVLGQEAPQLTSVANLVAAELGVSLVPRSISQVRVEGVEYLAIRGEPPVARLVLATGAEVRSVVVRQFVELAVARQTCSGG